MDIAKGLMITPGIRLDSPLAKGGMGSVWLADHLNLQMHVVVKLMARELVSDPEARARFAREGAAAAQVRSPHVVQMFDHGVTPDGLPFIVMEYLEGEDLARRLTRASLTPPELDAIIQQIAKALERAHARGVVHRDIKPANIFLCKSESAREETFVKLVDFGIAKAQQKLGDHSTKTGNLIGTPHYMSPEQLQESKRVDHRTDIWALGVVVFEVVTGVRPYSADTLGELILQVHMGETPRVTERAPSLPPALDTWFAKACARSPDDRFASAGQLADALSEVLRGMDRATVLPAARPTAAANAAAGGTVVSAGGTAAQAVRTATPAKKASGTLPLGPLTAALAPSAAPPPNPIAVTAGGVASDASYVRPDKPRVPIAVVAGGVFVVVALCAGAGAYVALRDPGAVNARSTASSASADPSVASSSSSATPASSAESPTPSLSSSSVSGASASALPSAVPAIAAQAGAAARSPIGQPPAKPSAAIAPTPSAKPTASAKPRYEIE